MTKIIPMSVMCIALTTNAFAKNNNQPPKMPQPPEPSFEMVMLMDRPMHRPPFMDVHAPRGPKPMEQIKLSDAQHEQMRALGKKHREQMDDLHDAREDLREEYLEKFEDILTDEQFRKIENLRRDLRKDMKKLNEKQKKLFEQHREDFEKILTDEQKKELNRMHHEHKPNHKMQKPAPFGTPNDAAPAPKHDKQKK
ncbi:MAG: Spy/CpxP family protein refolding chaperone [Alphaproteobacteria bacterium]|nr:Spy/CpxP family protein refolding chaperone [Alphaproteobacteria bacterium]